MGCDQAWGGSVGTKCCVSRDSVIRGRSPFISMWQNTQHVSQTIHPNGATKSIKRTPKNGKDSKVDLALPKNHFPFVLVTQVTHNSAIRPEVKKLQGLTKHRT